MQNDKKEGVFSNPITKLVIRIAFIVGITLCIALLAFAITRTLPGTLTYISNKISSLFAEKPDLTLTISKSSVISSEPFTASWSAATTTTGATLYYKCVSDISLVYITKENTQLPIQCGKQFKIGGNANQANLIANLAKENGFADLEITVTTTTQNDTNISDSAIVTVKSSKAASLTITATTTKTSTQTSTSTYFQSMSDMYYSYMTQTATTSETLGHSPTYSSHTTSYNYNIPQGPADLYISQITVGYDPITLEPIVNFTVSNIGGKATGNWKLVATLPNNDKLFESNILPSITPLGGSLFTLHLDSALEGRHSLVIFVDSNNQIIESNENNNSAEISVDFAHSGYSKGKADLVPKILSVTNLNNDAALVTFEIRNIGGTTAKDWKYEAMLPIEDEDTYTSKTQPDLAPGSSIVYTFTLEGIDDDYFEVEADSENDIKESNERNNTIRVRITN